MCQKLSCVLLVILNVFVLIAGIALIVVGGVIVGSKQFVTQQLRTAFDTASQSTGANEEVYSRVLKLFQEIAGPLGIALLVFGIFLFVIAIICFVGVCCHVRVMVIIYAIIVGVIALAHIILVIVYFSKKDIFLKVIYDTVQDMVKKYRSIENGDTDSITLGMLMNALGCCGFNSADDFTAPGTGFTRRDSYENVAFRNIAYPLPCCKAGSVGQAADACPQTFTAANSNKYVSCKTKIYNQVVPSLNVIMLSSLIILAVELLALALAIIYLCCEGK